MVVGAIGVAGALASYAFMPDDASSPAIGRHAPTAPALELPALLAELASSSPALGNQAKADGCSVRGPLPDPECSPGAVFAGKPLDEICQSGYTKKVRNVTASMKRKIYASYGIPYPPPTGSYELDHLIPLAIGGSNAPANLFPEAREPQPGFREKDLVEIYLRQEVCAGRADIDRAQRAVAADWVKIYESLTPEKIAKLRGLFNNWSN